MLHARYHRAYRMITFNDILQREGIDADLVKLVRHQDHRGSQRSTTPYQLWTARDGRFDQYQSIQGRLVFEDAHYLAAFVATPNNETLFVGLYSIGRPTKAPAGMIDPVGGHDVAGLNLYNLKRVDTLDEYAGRLVIDWGKGFRAWVQNAGNNNKAVRYILESEAPRPFPGFADFAMQLDALPTIPYSWKEKLSLVSGIYLLIHPESGKQYVGAAYGVGGFWARWINYMATGHGGNVRMQEMSPANYHVRILEVVSADLTDPGNEMLLAAEARWKRKLLSRDSQFGLNAN